MKFKKFLKILLNHYQMGEISDSSVVLAYYILLSLIPILMMTIAILHLVGIDFQSFFTYIKMILPPRIIQIVMPMINSAEHSGDEGQLSINILILIWSASRGIAAFKRVINKIYGIKGYNTIINRIISFVLLLLTAISSMALILFLEFGQSILNHIIPNSIISFVFRTMKWPLFLIILFGVNLLIFYFIPSVSTKIRYVWIGALISGIGSLLLSRLFSTFIVYFSHGLDAYKTLGAFIILMFWLYFLGIIVLFGAVVNASFQELMTGKITESRSFQKIIDSSSKLKLKK
ncbi:hypothetical protein WR164_10330 [Philodulcilactobacillus myokoensis]|uniref:Uncharacterized protein n=1 Tax=Philodulcilactobacillus myokoensis TaxID=2929573 RepID=A0A9W6B2W6_9LACO|nr:YihY/virulence factor BrkB family protein [Philodulcilactobacillus myokoensis]GLB47054.1 hypothetical protein WR164_10330 [Philodulcilactobacillus myokoensis]